MEQATLASSPGHSQLFIVSHEKREGLVMCVTYSIRNIPGLKLVTKKSYRSKLRVGLLLFNLGWSYHQHFELTYGRLVSTALRISVTFDLPHLQNLLSTLLSIYDATHVISRTRPSCFSRKTTKSWEWPGDEANICVHCMCMKLKSSSSTTTSQLHVLKPRESAYADTPTCTMYMYSKRHEHWGA